MELLTRLEHSTAIESNIEAIEAELKAFEKLYEQDQRTTARPRWMRLKTALEAEIERNRQQQKEYANYIAAITDPQIKQMIELHLNNVSWAKIHVIVYGYSTGGTGANYCYHKVTRYLKKHPMKGGLNDR